MESHSLQKIKDSGEDTSRLKTNGEVAKMFLVEFYRDLLMNSQHDQEPDTPKAILDKMLVR